MASPLLQEGEREHEPSLAFAPGAGGEQALHPKGPAPALPLSASARSLPSGCKACLILSQPLPRPQIFLQAFPFAGNPLSFALQSTVQPRTLLFQDPAQGHHFWEVP